MGSGLAAAVSFDIDWDLLPTAPGRRIAAIMGSSYGQALEKGEMNFGTMPTKAVSRHGISNIACRSHPTLPRDLRNLVKEAGAECTRPENASWTRSRARGCVIPIARSARVQGELKSIAGGADLIARGLDAYEPDGSPCPGPGAASSAGTPALQARALAIGIQRHQLSSLLRRQYAGRIACPRIRHVSTPSIGWSKS